MSSPPVAPPVTSDQRSDASPGEGLPPWRTIGLRWARELPLLIVALGWGVLLAVAAAVIVLSLAGPLDPTTGLVIAAGACGQGAIVTGCAFLVLAEVRRQHRRPARLTWTSASASPAAPGLPAAEPIATGEMNGRRYALFADGSVELLTLLGRRRFRTIAHAREFVGA